METKVKVPNSRLASERKVETFEVSKEIEFRKALITALVQLRASIDYNTMYRK